MSGFFVSCNEKVAASLSLLARRRYSHFMAEWVADAGQLVSILLQ